MPGSREWLYRRVEQWLDAVAPLRPGSGGKEEKRSTGHAPQATSPEAGSEEEEEEEGRRARRRGLDRTARMFMLLAGPGMGKSGGLGGRGLEGVGWKGVASWGEGLLNC